MKFTRFEYIKASMAVFSFSALQDFIAVEKSLLEYGIDQQEKSENVTDNKRILAGESAKESVTYKAASKYCFCPKCGGGLIIEPVNDSPRNMIDPASNDGELYQSLASCKDERGCGWQKFSNLTQYGLMKSFFPKGVQDGLVELTMTPHGHNDLEP